MSEDAENEASADFDNEEENVNNNNNNSMKESSSSLKLDDDTNANSYLKELLSAYNNISIGATPAKDSDGKSVISAREIMSANLDSSKFTVVKSSSRVDVTREDGEVECINQDPNPIVIKKQNNEEVVYKQNVYIRWLQPPTPPPPAPIISKVFIHISYLFDIYIHLKNNIRRFNLISKPRIYNNLYE